MIQIPERGDDAQRALLAALEGGDADLVRDLLPSTWTGALDGHHPTLHDALRHSASSVPPSQVPAVLRALLAVTRRHPGGQGEQSGPGDSPIGQEQPNGPDDPLATFVRLARLRRAGRTDDALRLARGSLSVDGRGSAEARVLVGLQAAITATQAGLLHEALRYAEDAHRGALACGLRPPAAAAAEMAALIHALDSNVHAVHVWSTEADVLPGPPGWWRHVAGDLPALVSALTHLALLDDDFPDLLASAAHDAAGSDLWFAGLHLEAMLAVLRRQEAGAVKRLRDALAQRELTPWGTGTLGEHGGIPPLVALDLGRLYLSLGRGTNAAVIADTVITRAPAGALLHGGVRLAQGRPRDALLAISEIKNLGATAGARLEAHLMAAEALTAARTLTDRGAAVGDTDGIHRELRQAVALSEQVGALYPFWWASAGVLRSADAPGPVRERIAQVVRRRGEPAAVEFVAVSDRQLALLHQLADGLTYAEMARASSVPPHAVRTQLRRIYLRLGVDNRAAALSRARDLGLLDPMIRGRRATGSRGSMPTL